MKRQYKGFEIEITRESRGALAYFSIFREHDGFEILTDFIYDSTPIREQMGWLKSRVDEMIATQGRSEDVPQDDWEAQP